MRIRNAAARRLNECRDSTLFESRHEQMGGTYEVRSRLFQGDKILASKQPTFIKAMAKARLNEDWEDLWRMGAPIEVFAVNYLGEWKLRSDGVWCKVVRRSTPEEIREAA